MLTCKDKPIRTCADGERTRICVPADYIKFELPEDERATYVSIGVDIKDIPKVNDKDFSITMNAYFIVKWQDRRLIVERRNRTSKHFIPDTYSTTSTTSSPTLSSNIALHEENGSKLTAVNLNILRNLWLPDVEILNLKAFETHSVLSKLEGVWIDDKHQLLYALATRITFICPMKFNAFPMDIQRCKFQVRTLKTRQNCILISGCTNAIRIDSQWLSCSLYCRGHLFQHDDIILSRKLWANISNSQEGKKHFQSKLPWELFAEWLWKPPFLTFLNDLEWNSILNTKNLLWLFHNEKYVWLLGKDVSFWVQFADWK